MAFGSLIGARAVAATIAVAGVESARKDSGLDFGTNAPGGTAFEDPV
jgi:hypothetical protein